DRLLNGIVRLNETVVAGRIVVVGTDRLGDAPVRHPEFRVELRSALERTRGFIVIKRVNLAKTLVEKRLGRFIGRDRVVKVSVALHQAGLLGVGRWHGMILRERCQRKTTDRENEKKYGPFFHVTP